MKNQSKAENITIDIDMERVELVFERILTKAVQLSKSNSMITIDHYTERLPWTTPEMSEVISLLVLEVMMESESSEFVTKETQLLSQCD